MVDRDAYIEAASAMVGLTIADAWRPGVARFLALAAEMAQVLDTVELDDGDLALASVYSPPDIRSSEGGAAPIDDHESE